MRTWDIKRTVFTVADFLSWLKSKELDLNPPFQRRQVWKPKAKSLFIDTVYRGLPVPIIFLRERTELSSLRTIREVVDGQQRLRTIISFVSPEYLKGFKPERDKFAVLRTHNPELAGKDFHDLDDVTKMRILNFQFSVDVLPSDTVDVDLLEIFSRMNATGVKLNKQELRNAEYLGDFKTAVYAAAYEQLDRWRLWGLFTEDQIARMSEVEFTSELFMYLMSGVQQKSPSSIDNIYDRNDDEFPAKDHVIGSLRSTLDYIDEIVGQDIRNTVFRRPPLFYALFAAVHQLRHTPPHLSTHHIRDRLKEASNRIGRGVAPENVINATARRTTHKSSREAVIGFVAQMIHG